MRIRDLRNAGSPGGDPPVAARVTGAGEGPVTRVFLGGVVRSWSEAWVPLRRLRVSADEVAARTFPGGPIRLSRAEVDAVTVHRVRQPGVYRTVVEFRRGADVPLMFVPFRSRAVPAALRDLGWPVADR